MQEEEEEEEKEEREKQKQKAKGHYLFMWLVIFLETFTIHLTRFVLLQNTEDPGCAVMKKPKQKFKFWSYLYWQNFERGLELKIFSHGFFPCPNLLLTSNMEFRCNIVQELLIRSTFPTSYNIDYEPLYIYIVRFFHVVKVEGIIVETSPISKY